MNKASAFEMDALDSRIQELVAYARERDGEDRATLFRNLVDLFLTGKAPKIDPTRGQLLDVLQALIPHVDAEGRRTVCDLIANMATPPIDLVQRLAQDRVAIVGNLLKNVQFDDDDLIELIEQTGREHHQVIASREDLSANIWIALARAAPSAPPFDQQSTLALWSDDLGITQTETPAEPVSTDNTDDRKIAPGIGDPEKAAAKQRKQTRPQSATVTPLHPEKNSSIRILRTDEDLLATRAGAEPAQTPEQALKTEPKPVLQRTPISEAADALQATEEATAANLTANSSQEPAPDTSVGTPFKEAQDPGPGGWAWISDRDGFVTSVSSHGMALLGESFSPVGTSMLDLLGLNTKLGHPVARAFQRRSAIHDAPIFLTALEDKNQHWTLEAKPFFSSCGGIFEGYEGTLTPVVPASNDDLLPLAEDDGSALFLDEVAARPAAKLRVMPPAFTDQASVLSAEVPPSMIDGSKTPVEELRPTEQIVPISSDAISETPETEDVPTSTGTDASSLLSEATATIVREALREAFGPAAGDTAPTPTAEHQQSVERTTEPEPMAVQVSAGTQAHVTATLEMLEEAVARLSEAGKSANEPQIRLQSEIAAACVRSLKDQLT